MASEKSFQLLKPANSCVGVCVYTLAGATETEVEALPMYITVWASPCHAGVMQIFFISVYKYMPRLCLFQQRKKRIGNKESVV